MSTRDEGLSDELIRDYEMTAVDASALMIQGTRGHILATHAVPDLVAEIKRLRGNSIADLCGSYTAQLADLQAGIRTLADRCVAEPWTTRIQVVTALRALVGDETPGTGEHA